MSGTFYMNLRQGDGPPNIVIMLGLRVILTYVLNHVPKTLMR